jgi:3-methyladenine DNA glycosylase AlkD
VSAVVEGPTAAGFVERMVPLVPPAVRSEFKRAVRAGGRRADGEGAGFGIRTGSIFALAKEFIDLLPAEIEELLDSPIHEVRVGALSVMDKQARRNRTPEGRRKELFDLYLRRSDAIDSWDLVDLGAPFVIGRYLWDKPRKVLYRLARSKNPWERRTAIVSTLYFVRNGDVEDTFELAKLLVHDDHDYVQKATGGLLREAGKKDLPRLRAFLGRHAAGMARTTLSYAAEHLTKSEREHYRGLRAPSEVRRDAHGNPSSAGR